MNQQDFTKIIMNPVRQRIVQYLILHEEGTVSSIREELNDIPPASLYRHIKILYEAGGIEVVRERKVRGTVEKTYALVKNPTGEYSREGAAQMIQAALFSLAASFSLLFCTGGERPEEGFAEPVHLHPASYR